MGGKDNNSLGEGGGKAALDKEGKEGSNEEKEMQEDLDEGGGREGPDKGWQIDKALDKKRRMEGSKEGE